MDVIEAQHGNGAQSADLEQNHSVQKPLLSGRKFVGIPNVLEADESFFACHIIANMNVIPLDTFRSKKYNDICNTKSYSK